MSKIVVDGIIFEEAPQGVTPVRAVGRDWLRLTLYATVESAKASFSDNVLYYREWESETDGKTETVRQDLSDWCVAGDVADHRNGSVSVYMGKHTDEELQELRTAEAAAALTDEAAASMPSLYPEFEPGIEITSKMIAENKNRYRYKNGLYKCLIAHTTTESWAPDIAPTVWERIDNGHAGTQEDPVPAAAGLRYQKGLVYDDAGTLYVCIRDDTGVGTVLYYLPHELVGSYFEVLT